MEESALILRAKAGDQVALARLLQEHYLPVKKYLLTVTLDRTLADDLTQETMIRAMQRIRQYEGRSRFSTWLISIATHLFLDELRRRKRETARFEALALELQATGDDEAALPAWLDLLERLHALPRDVSLPIVLKHYHGYTVEQIARLMGIPEGTVKSRIHNGIRSLRAGEKEGEPGEA